MDIGGRVKSIFSSKHPYLKFIFFIAGLAIELTVIVASFFWRQDQFGPPYVQTGLLAFLAFLSLLPFIGYVDFFFCAIWLFEIGGRSVFTHPWLYFVIGIAFVEMGMILLMKEASKSEDG